MKMIPSKSIFKAQPESAFTLVELMVAMLIASILAGLVIFHYIFIYTSMSDTSRELDAQRKARMIIERVLRGPPGGLGGIRSAYYNSSSVGIAGGPNLVINDIPTPGVTTNQTASFYVQRDFTGFNYPGILNYLDPAVTAHCIISMTGNTVLYQDLGPPAVTTTLVGSLPVGVTITRFAFIPDPMVALGAFSFGTQPSPALRFEFDLSVTKANGTVLTKSYSARTYYRDDN